MTIKRGIIYNIIDYYEIMVNFIYKKLIHKMLTLSNFIIIII